MKRILWGVGWTLAVLGAASAASDSAELEKNVKSVGATATTPEKDGTATDDPPSDPKILERVVNLIAEVETRRAGANGEVIPGEDPQAASRRRYAIALELLHRRETRNLANLSPSRIPTEEEIQSRRQRIVEELRRRREERGAKGPEESGGTKESVKARDPSAPIDYLSFSDLPMAATARVLRDLTGKEVLISAAVTDRNVSVHAANVSRAEAISLILEACRVSGVIADDTQPGRLLLLAAAKSALTASGISPSPKAP